MHEILKVIISISKQRGKSQNLEHVLTADLARVNNKTNVHNPQMAGIDSPLMGQVKCTLSSLQQLLCNWLKRRSKAINLNDFLSAALTKIREHSPSHTKLVIQLSFYISERHVQQIYTSISTSWTKAISRNKVQVSLWSTLTWFYIRIRNVHYDQNKYIATKLL